MYFVCLCILYLGFIFALVYLDYLEIFSQSLACFAQQKLLEENVVTRLGTLEILWGFFLAIRKCQIKSIEL